MHGLPQARLKIMASSNLMPTQEQPRMRLMLSSLLAATLLSGPVFAAECAKPVEHTAMDLTSLKTNLMVMALTCKVDEKYNAFVVKYRPELVQTDKTLNAFFSRAYGRSSAKQRDDYVTQLANSLSQLGLKQGSAYCDRNLAVFEEVMGLRNSGELTDFAAGKAGAQPIAVSDCGLAPERPAHTAARRKS
jgi:phosphate-selective porin